MENFTDYKALTGQIRGLTEGVPHVISNLANVSALLWQTLPEINWVGFYHLEGEKLILYPFQGKPACIEIPLGRGVCGRAAEEDRVCRVEDVHAFPGHIACDSASNSEIVILWLPPHSRCHSGCLAIGTVNALRRTSPAC